MALLYELLVVYLSACCGGLTAAFPFQDGVSLLGGFVLYWCVGDVRRPHRPEEKHKALLRNTKAHQEGARPMLEEVSCRWTMLSQEEVHS